MHPLRNQTEECVTCNNRQLMGKNIKSKYTLLTHTTAAIVFIVVYNRQIPRWPHSAERQLHRPPVKVFHFDSIFFMFLLFLF